MVTLLNDCRGRATVPGPATISATSLSTTSRTVLVLVVTLAGALVRSPDWWAASAAWTPRETAAVMVAVKA